MKEEAMYWWINHYPAGTKRKLAAAINVPLWTLR